MPGAHVAFGRFLGGTAGKLGAACAMLAAVASIVLVSGGAGVFGPLGSFIAGHGSRTATEAAASAGAAGSASSPIVAAPAGSAAGPVGSGGGRGEGGQPAPGGGRVPGRGPQGSVPSLPGGGGGTGSGPSPGQPSPSPSPTPSRPPSQVAQAVDDTGSTVEQVGHQVPAARPVTDTVGGLTHQVADTCRRLTVCP